MKHLAVILVCLGFALPARAEPMKEFITTCTYGVLAGTLVGAATLAFTNNPGDNLNNIARGASIGLYAGILLGAYIVYGVDGGEESYDGDIQPEEGGYEEEAPPVEGGEEPAPEAFKQPMLFPIVSNHGIEGVGASVKLLTF